MSDSNIITDAMLEKLRCSICTEYLTCPPIQMLSDGKSICGSCALSGREGPVSRNITLEEIISTVSFPCKYKTYGCEERFLFGEAHNHDATCNYRGFPCPDAECLWRGPIRLLPQHFTENHPNLVLERAELILDVAENKEEIAMLVVEGVKFMLKYKYNAAARELCYDIRFFKSVKEASCKFKMFNDSDHDYNVMTKGNDCQAYGYNFNNPEIANILHLTNYLTVLNEPIRVMFAINLSFTMDNYNDLLKCVSCSNYLAIPIFEDENGANNCGSCSNREFGVRLRPTSNNDAVKQVVSSIIPCRWDNCKVVKTGDKIRQHEKYCKNRVYSCDRLQIDTHMRTEHSEYKAFVSNCNFVIEYSKSGMVSNVFYSFLNNDIVFIIINSNNNRHNIYVRVTEFINSFHVTIVFSHSHCNKFKQFIVDRHLQVTSDMLPECFLSTNINVTIQV